MELTTLANNQGKALKESFANFDNSENLNKLSQHQKELRNSMKTSTIYQTEGTAIFDNVEPVSQSLDESYNDELSQLTSQIDDRTTTVRNYLNTVSEGNKYLGQNVQFSNATGYITPQGIFKNYGSDGVVFNTTTGKHNCPGGTPITYPLQNATIPYTDVGGVSQNAQYSFVVGTPMQSGQSCGNEGQNVFVDTVKENASATLLGSYMDSIESPTMTFLDSGNSSFTYDTCLQAAVNNGYPFFALQSADPTQSDTEQLTQCAVATSTDNAMSIGEAQTSCQQQSDSYVYGGPESIALYKVPQFQHIATFDDNPNRAMTWVNNGSQTYSVQQCYEYALNNGYTFFGLQNGSNPSNAQCFVSNDYTQSTEYGESPERNTRYSSEDREFYGGPWANAIYYITGAANNLGCFANNSNSPPMTVLSENSDFASCQNEAQSTGYTFFGLGGGGPGQATCYGSQNEPESKQYGVYTPSVTLPDGQLYGTNAVNTIYKVKGEMYSENLGQIGYVDENTTLLPYPDNLITNTGTEYAVLNNIVEPATLASPDLTGVSTQECQDECNGSSDCGGFFFDNSNNCYLQPTNFMQQQQEPNTTSTTLPTADAYIRIPAVTNADSCSKQVNTIDADQWQHYPQDGRSMTESQPCGLEAVTKPETDRIDRTSSSLTSMISGVGDFHQFYSTFLEGFRGGIYDKIEDNSRKIQDSALFVEHVDSQMAKQLSNQILNVSNISVLEKYTNYNTSFGIGIVCLILAVVAVILSFFM